MGCGASTGKAVAAADGSVPAASVGSHNAAPASTVAPMVSKNNRFPQDNNKCSAYNACAQAHEQMGAEFIPSLTELTEFFAKKPKNYSRSDDTGDELKSLLKKVLNATDRFDRRVKHAITARRNIGLLNPQPYMAKYIEQLRHRYNITILNPDETDSSKETIAALAAECKEKDIPSIVGLAQKDSWQHALINREMGHVSISSLAYLVAMNKFMQRTIEAKPFFFAPVTPETETNDEIVAKIPENEWPCMLKNTSLSLGRGVFRCKTPEAMCAILDEYRGNTALQAAIKKTNDSILEHFTEDDRSKLDCAVPPFLVEHCVNLELGWVEYCYEGCISEEGKLAHYGFTEEMYSTDHAGLAYITPPMSYPRDKIKDLENYLEGYMSGLIKKGYLRQFFNVEIWALAPENGPVEFCFCEINPRCAHAYHIPYQIAYKTNLWADNFDLVLDNKLPTVTPWSKWTDNDYTVSLQALINVMGCEGKLVREILDYQFVDHIEGTGKVELVRHVKQRDYTITADDAASGAGCTLLQIFIKCTTHEEAAAYEVALRDIIYRIPQGDKQPDWWLAKAAKGNVEAQRAKLQEGLERVDADTYDQLAAAKTNKD
ncbi:unnamed protein product [Amoebophrya sp. A25]|nr:unnamed protein product [Amoebophrya sp. A25]|eukprot:GSA25T00010269001.1